MNTEKSENNTDSASRKIEEDQVPLVFISYSHDSKEHKQWVAKLAGEIRSHGVEVLFDQWDLSLGDDVPKFMERAVREADRVLMICTEPYVRKADDGKGGVGYEAMDVTGELVRDLGTNKFIPVIRQATEEKSVPACVSTRLFVDFSQDKFFEEKFEELITELRKIRGSKKPPLGRNLLAAEHNASSQKRVNRIADFGSILQNPISVYQEALEIVRSNDFIAWRKLTRAAEAFGVDSAKSWAGDMSKPPKAPERVNGDWSSTYSHLMEGIMCYESFLGCLLAAAETGEPRFSHQLGWLDSLIQPPDWGYPSYVYWAEFPELVVYVFQALVGATLFDVGDFEGCRRLAATSVQRRLQQYESSPLYREPYLNGWPKTLNNDCRVAWGFLEKCLSEYHLIQDVFGSTESCKKAVSGYYLVQNVLNFHHEIESGGIPDDPKEQNSMRLLSPLNFTYWGSQITTSAYKRLMRDPEFVLKLIAPSGIFAATLNAEWGKWMKVNHDWLWDVRPGVDGWLPHENLVNELLKLTGREIS